MLKINSNTKKIGVVVCSSLIITGIVIYGKFCEKRGREIGKQEGIDTLRNLSNKIIPDYEEKMEEFYEYLRSERENKK